MNPKLLDERELLDIWREDGSEQFEIVHESEWEDQGKFSSKEVVFKDIETGKHYSFEIYRSGSYFSYYEFEIYDTAVEVNKRERTITIEEWVTVQ